MTGKRVAFKGGAYYQITMEGNTKEPLGKLKAVQGEDNTFTLYDCGKNYKEKMVSYNDIRQEFGTFIFWYQKNVKELRHANLMRNMTVILP